MAFEFRDILPAVGAVIGFGFGGPGGAALGSGIGSLARGDEADEALKNAALGYVGGKGTQFLGSKVPGFDNFLANIPGGSFVQGGMNKDIFSTAIGKGQEFLGLDPEAQFAKKVEKYNKMKDVFNNFDYFEFKGEWGSLDEVGIEILKNNILRNKNLKTIFKTQKIWGYSFKEDKNKHVFKIVDERYKVYDNEPGKVIGDKGFPMLTLLQEFMNNFNKNHAKYIDKMEETLVEKKKVKQIKKNVEELKGDNDIPGLVKYLFKELRAIGKQKIITKDYITKMYEFSLRIDTKTTFFSYDTFLFKFVNSL